LHNPPGEGNALALAPNAPHALKEKEREIEEEEPQMNQWSCLLAFLVAIPLLAVTAEWVGFLLLAISK
jgi:Ca2+:H+ antiporter